MLQINNFQMVKVKDKLIMMLKDPISIVATDIPSKLGNPKDIVEVKSSQTNFELDKQFEIPQNEHIEDEILSPIVSS